MHSVCSHLVDRVENLRKNALGNGSSECVLCGDEFGVFGASPAFCDDCVKVNYGASQLSCYVLRFAFLGSEMIASEETRDYS